MIAAFLLSLRQLGDPRIVRVFVTSFAVTVLLMATLGAALWWSARAAARTWLAASDTGAGVAGFLALLAAVALAWLLFRAIAIAVIGIFADDVVAAVEARHYPAALASARPVPLARSAVMGAASAARAILVNLAATPLYILLLVTGIGTPIGFFVVNAGLLARDLGDMVAVRHVERRALPDVRRATRGARLMLGAVTTGLLLIPFVNLLAPVLGAAMATHVFHRSLAR